MTKPVIDYDVQKGEEEAVEIWGRSFVKRIRKKQPTVYCDWCTKPISHKEKTKYWSSFKWFRYDTPWDQKSYLKFCEECFERFRNASVP